MAGIYYALTERTFPGLGIVGILIGYPFLVQERVPEVFDILSWFRLGTFVYGDPVRPWLPHWVVSLSSWDPFLHDQLRDDFCDSVHQHSSAPLDWILGLMEWEMIQLRRVRD